MAKNDIFKTLICPVHFLRIIFYCLKTYTYLVLPVLSTRLSTENVDNLNNLLLLLGFV